MIVVFFNENGFSIAGEHVDVALRCSPAIDGGGERLFSEIHHTYKVLWLAMNEIKNRRIEGDITVYGCTRIIDEMSYVIDPLDDGCRQWRNYIKRETLSLIRSIVFFRKKPQEYVQSNLEKGQTIIKQIDSAQVRSLLEILTRNKQDHLCKKKINAISRFKGQRYGRQPSK